MAAVVWECSIHTWKVLVPIVSGCTGGSDCGLLVLGVTNHWTGLLDGTLDWTGLTYFWFLHILRLALLNLASQSPSENLHSAQY